MLDRAERLQRQFFSHSAAAWEPPVDIHENAEGVVVQVALPGVPADSVTIALEPAGVAISALRAFPCRNAAHIHRVEIPYGRFERYIGLPLGDSHDALELTGKHLADGLLTLTFRKKEGA